ncbi:uncharacterized protein BDR25DRAFT_123822 [Lindgomyces ingoldianus]|uniref:Uncharacterized protein n=1 Tax=Lindgomyces ingoldianus TaxID=673940 RepID=A0ACB6R300_9PLEO|nr:uncharacterized protein BDR25DRAFT_123822 [Lindgomyces ingoldianus]KAF2473551.1 hypothetical protein BDR25DRAFT_123822 [Lindgomyces ingoldianus]
MSVPIQPASNPTLSRNPPQSPPAQHFRSQPAAGAVSPLNNIPTDIATHRALLFALDTPVQLTPAVWDRFWPYIDNVWCVHQKPHPSSSTGIAKIYGGCRLNRKTNFPPPVIHEHSRPRQRREGGTCKAKFRLTLYPDGRRVVERMGEGHSHTLEHIDSIKRNTGVRNLVLDDFFKSWEAGGILAFLRDTSAAGDPEKDALKDAGGLYLSRQEVQNILNGALKKAYPGQDISEVKKQMDKYKNYTTCNFKGCNAPAFPDIKTLMEHRRSVHGLKSHDHSDKVYSCPDKGCWRRKKSKGFATLLGLEEHVREKHGSGSQIQGMQGQGDGLLDPILANQLSGIGNLNLPLNINMSNLAPVIANLGSLPLLSDPITPDSSGEEQGQVQDMITESQGVEEASRALSHMEKEGMKIRIKRLMIERQKLDTEIKRLNKAVWGDERGEMVPQELLEEHGNAVGDGGVG